MQPENLTSEGVRVKPQDSRCVHFKVSRSPHFLFLFFFLLVTFLCHCLVPWLCTSSKKKTSVICGDERYLNYKQNPWNLKPAVKTLPFDFHSSDANFWLIPWWAVSSLLSCRRGTVKCTNSTIQRKLHKALQTGSQEFAIFASSSVQGMRIVPLLYTRLCWAINIQSLSWRNWDKPLQNKEVKATVDEAPVTEGLEYRNFIFI